MFFNTSILNIIIGSSLILPVLITFLENKRKKHNHWVFKLNHWRVEKSTYEKTQTPEAVLHSRTTLISGGWSTVDRLLYNCWIARTHTHTHTRTRTQCNIVDGRMYKITGRPTMDKTTNVFSDNNTISSGPVTGILESLTDPLFQSASLLTVRIVLSNNKRRRITSVSHTIRPTPQTIKSTFV